MQRVPFIPTLLPFALAAFMSTSQAQIQMGHDVLLFSSLGRGKSIEPVASLHGRLPSVEACTKAGKTIWDQNFREEVKSL